MKIEKPIVHGQPITWEEATDMIGTYKQIKDITETKISLSKTKVANNLLLKKAQAMIDNNHQAFVFSKEIIMRFFDGSEKDEFGNPVCANYLMVILGAHHGNNKHYEAGTLNVITAGVEKRIEKNENGKAETRYYPLKKLKFAANEYGQKAPPATESATIKNKAVNNNIDYFVGS